MQKFEHDSHKHKIDISIIVPAFKPEQYLVRFIDRISELDQAFLEKQIYSELIFIHNGIFCDSNKSVTRLIIAEFSKLKSISFNYLPYKKKITPSRARNIGIESSSGEYIFFHDVDDLFNLNFVESLPKLIRSDLGPINRYDFIIFNYCKIRNGLEELITHGSQIRNAELNKKSLFDYLNLYMNEPHIYTFFVHCWSKLYRRKFLTDRQIMFNEKLDQLEDVNFNFQILMHKPRIYYANKTAYNYYIGRNYSNLSSNSGNNGKSDIRAAIKALSIVKTYLIRSGMMSKAVKYKIRHLYATTYVLWMLRVGKRAQNMLQLHHSLKAYVNSPIVHSSMRYYLYLPQTSWWLPKLVLHRLNVLLTIFLYIKTRG